ncbi:MAG: DUF4123 domain-containing protein [Phycisphaerae bacterium]|nr:DUF4123 domain-containing protein [Phycisphaerae bacterium]
MSAGERLYAVVDAARDAELAFAARDRFGLGLHTLFEGDLAQYLDHVAPHLVGIEQGSEYLELWAEHLGRSAGILLFSEASTEVIRAHLRRIFVVTDEECEEFSFRYYDPRVLRVYLRTCTAAEAQEFFGPIRRIVVESERSGRLLSCSPERNGVKMAERSLQPDDTGSSATGGARP